MSCDKESYISYCRGTDSALYNKCEHNKVSVIRSEVMPLEENGECPNFMQAYHYSAYIKNLFAALEKEKENLE